MRYLILVLLNLPVILLALVNIVTRYKLHKIDKAKFKQQVTLWGIVLIVLVGSFPFYNYINGRPYLDSSELSLFDIVQTTVLIFLFYIINRQRQQLDQTERLTRDLHQEVSIRLSSLPDKFPNKKV